MSAVCSKVIFPAAQYAEDSGGIVRLGFRLGHGACYNEWISTAQEGICLQLQLNRTWKRGHVLVTFAFFILDAFLQVGVVRHYCLGEIQVAHRVFMSAEHAGLGWQRGKLLQRTIHHGRRAFEHAAAARSKQGISTE